MEPVSHLEIFFRKRYLIQYIVSSIGFLNFIEKSHLPPLAFGTVDRVVHVVVTSLLCDVTIN